MKKELKESVLKRYIKEFGFTDLFGTGLSDLNDLRRYAKHAFCSYNSFGKDGRFELYETTYDNYFKIIEQKTGSHEKLRMFLQRRRNLLLY